jgi:hypothetical protein
MTEIHGRDGSHERIWDILGSQEHHLSAP